MSEETEIRISISHRDFKAAQEMAAQIFAKIAGSTSFKEIGHIGGGGGDGGTSYCVWLQYPLRERIRVHREAAEALEKQLAVVTETGSET